MSDTVIKVEHLSKQYRLGTISHGLLYRDLQSWVSKILGKEDPNSLVTARQVGSNDHKSDHRFMALDDISLEVKQGTALGIIGRNGAGKSTLLKIISRITAPTQGQVKFKGRVASLLEVGTGFHPELTGRENIYLNGSILGMNRQETKKKFDEIVSFAEIENFLDTPVKRYSSGMYVRLAFAVAAHLDPEILLVDEVLSVGDIQFQKKCLGKMKSVGKEGRTVLFVSHNMATISSLCTNGIMLNGGKLVKAGNMSEIILAYYSEGLTSPASFNYEISNKLVGDNHVLLLSGTVEDDEGNACCEILITKSLVIKMRYRIISSYSYIFVPNFHFFSSNGACAFVSHPQDVAKLKAGVYEVECHIPGNFLNEGMYFVGLAMTSFELGPRIHFYEQSALSFNIKDPIENVPTRNNYGGSIPGIVRPLLDWQIKSIS